MIKVMCDIEKLKRGFPIPTDLSFNVFDPANVCLKFDSAYVRLKNNKDIKYPLTFFKNKQLPDGIFNFIFAEDNTLYAAPLDNAFEIGAKHKHVAMYARTRIVKSAGEMLKSGNTIQFNLSSGTFMKDFMVTVLDKQCNNELISHTIELFKLYYPGYNIQFVTRTFLTLTELPLKREHMLKYVNAGYEVRLYNMKKTCMEEQGPFTLFQSAARRKTRRRRTLKKH